MKESTSIPNLFQQVCESVSYRRFLTWLDPNHPDQKPVTYSYADFFTLVCQVISVLQEEGFKKGDRVVFLAENSPAWQAVSIAAQTLRGEPSALFASLGNIDVIDILQRVKPTVLFVSNADQWDKIGPTLPKIKSCRVVISTSESLNVPKNIRFFSLSDIINREPISELEYEELSDKVGLEDPFVMIFTSGTTGRQKGVRLPQRAALSALHSGIEATKMTAKDTGLHILPFAHIAGLCAFYAAIGSESSLILCSRREDLLRGFHYRPTYTLLVPLIYERIQKDLIKKIGHMPNALSNVFQSSISAAQENVRRHSLGNKIKGSLAHYLLGNLLKKKLGGRIRMLGAGGAHSEPDLIAFFRGLGLDYVNLYGMSETCGTISFCSAGDPDMNIYSVGRPPKDVRVKIDATGEILVKGKVLMTGYLEEEDKKDVFTNDGYFRTGDLGSLNEDGLLFITGRKKHILVLSTGKKVCPEPIEMKLRQGLSISDAVVIGDGQAFISAGLFIPNDDLQALEKKIGSDQIVPHLMKKVQKALKGFSEYEIPKRLFIIPGTPVDYPKIITPTLKIKRSVFLKHFDTQIKAVYSTQVGGTKSYRRA